MRRTLVRFRFTGADLASVMNEAVLLAIRDGSPDAQICASHLSEAVQRVLHGPHRGKLLAPEERQRIAVHETGHAVVAAACGRGGDVVRVSVVARGKGVGSTNIGVGDKALLTGDDIKIQLAVAMGGMAAEKAVYGGGSTMPEDDISQATGLAKLMVGIYGMSDRIGRVQMLNRFGGGFLGGDGWPTFVKRRAMWPPRCPCLGHRALAWTGELSPTMRGPCLSSRPCRGRQTLAILTGTPGYTVVRQRGSHRR